MNVVLEQKLKDLWQSSLDQNAPAIHVVAHLLLAHYQQGSQGEFAKWCCQFSPGINMNASLNDNPPPGDFSDEPEWIC
ncbi:MAG: hypothetical protein U0Y68_00270 [Blastocatellia bacterium]